MSDDPIAVLERELVIAARRRAAAGPVPDVVPWPRARRRRIRVGDALSAAAAAGAAIVALAALALLGGGGGGHPASTAAATPREKLVATLAVLRRPQTAADLALPELSRAHTPHAVFRPLRRRTAGTSTISGIPGATFYAPLRARSKQGESITVFGAPGGSANSLLGFTAADIAQGRAVVDEAGYGAARHPIRLLAVIPDGVTVVEIAFVRGPIRHARSTSEKLLIDDEPTHGNVAAFQQVGVRPSRPWVMVWFDARHKVINRIRLPTDLG